MKRFALIGAAGFISPRHMEAIQKTNNVLVAAMDLSDSVGVMDRYFPECQFFTEIEIFDEYLGKLKREGNGVDYISICSPNYLHSAHCCLSLRYADVICEKPLVINPDDLDQLSEIEEETDHKIYTIMQLRLHPEIIKLKQNLKDSYYKVKLRYITRRGSSWYNASWKGQVEKSGGLIMNIGIHLFDLLIYLFGDVQSNDLKFYYNDKARGTLILERATVEWFLSIDVKDLPRGSEGPIRELQINGEPIDLSKMNNLHTKSYQNILKGEGFGIEDTRPVIEFLGGKNWKRI